MSYDARGIASRVDESTTFGRTINMRTRHEWRAAKQLASGAILMLALAAPAPAAEEPSATPYRPTVSNPAELSAPGWLEFEAGGLRQKGGELKRRDSIPYLAKVAFSEDWGVLLGGEARVEQIDRARDRMTGIGDTQLLLKRRIAVNNESAFGFEAGLKVPTAKRGIGSDHTDYILNGIYSHDVGSYHLDVNLGLTRLGTSDPGDSRTQTGWAVAISRELTDRWTLAAELAGTTRRGASDPAQFLVAAGYAVSKRVVLDAGVAFGLNDASPDWQFFAGITMLLGRLW